MLPVTWWQPVIVGSSNEQLTCDQQTQMSMSVSSLKDLTCGSSPSGMLQDTIPSS